MSGGYVYILTNESMPEIVKIGFSRRSGKSRAFELYENKTGVPTPFRCEFEIWTEYPEHVEQETFERLKQWRVNEFREFFRVSVTEAKIQIMDCILEEIDHRVDHVDFRVDEATEEWLHRGLERLTGKPLLPPEVFSAIGYLTAEELLPALQRYRETMERLHAERLAKNGGSD